MDPIHIPHDDNDDQSTSTNWFKTTTGKNIIAGTIGGIAGVIAGHPFDTVKVRLQSQHRIDSYYRGTFDCFRKIYREEGARAWFKGMTSPLIGVATVNAVLFGVYGSLLRAQQGREGNINEPATLKQVFWAGCGSGLVNSFISAPTELVKIQLQNQRVRLYRGPMDCFKTVWRNHGLRGIFRGFSATVLRETPSYGVYFATFEGLKGFYEDRKNREIGGGGLLLAGGISGVLGWLSTYPIDVIKTRLQGLPINNQDKKFQNVSMWSCYRGLVKEDGYGSLVRGLWPTIIRAFPTNAVIFLAYSWSMRALDEL